jgi:hypothetical protein
VFTASRRTCTCIFVARRLQCTDSFVRSRCRLHRQRLLPRRRRVPISSVRRRCDMRERAWLLPLHLPGWPRGQELLGGRVHRVVVRQEHRVLCRYVRANKLASLQRCANRSLANCSLTPLQTRIRFTAYASLDTMETLDQVTVASYQSASLARKAIHTTARTTAATSTTKERARTYSPNRVQALTSRLLAFHPTSRSQCKTSATARAGFRSSARFG